MVPSGHACGGARGRGWGSRCARLCAEVEVCGLGGVEEGAGGAGREGRTVCGKAEGAIRGGARLGRGRDKGEAGRGQRRRTVLPGLTVMASEPVLSRYDQPLSHMSLPKAPLKPTDVKKVRSGTCTEGRGLERG